VDGRCDDGDAGNSDNGVEDGEDVQERDERWSPVSPSLSHSNSALQQRLATFLICLTSGEGGEAGEGAQVKRTVGVVVAEEVSAGEVVVTCSGSCDSAFALAAVSAWYGWRCVSSGWQAMMLIAAGSVVDSNTGTKASINAVVI
jgi:hypothetical protein